MCHICEVSTRLLGLEIILTVRKTGDRSSQKKAFFEIKADLPGYEKKDVKIEVKDTSEQGLGPVLILTAEFKTEEEVRREFALDVSATFPSKADWCVCVCVCSWRVTRKTSCTTRSARRPR